MSKVQNHSKVARPNRLVNKHEEYLINKSLANKVRHVKSSIPVENQNFERVLITRQKRETQRSSHNKLRHPESHDELEEDHNEHYEHNKGEANLQEFYTKDFYGTAADTLHIRTAGSSSRGGQDNHLLMAKSGPIQFASSPRSIIERNGYGKVAAFGSTTSYRKESRGASPEKADVIAEKIAEKNREVEMLKNKLAEKSHEIESLKSELKGKWHENFESPSKENQAQNGQTRGPIMTLNKDISSKTLKPMNMGKSSVVGMERQDSGAKLKKQLSLGSDQKKMNDFVHKHQAQYEESLKILERFEEIEKNKKKLEPIKRDTAAVKKELPERPASVKNKTKPNNDKFKIRFSNNYEHGILKTNTRYKSDGVDVINEMAEQEREETLGESVEEKLEIKEPKIPAAHQRKNNRYQQAEPNYDEDLTEAESPQIEVTSKTLMLQSKIISSMNNGYGSRYNGLTDSEVLIE